MGKRIVGEEQYYCDMCGLELPREDLITTNISMDIEEGGNSKYVSIIQICPLCRNRISMTVGPSLLDPQAVRRKHFENMLIKNYHEMKHTDVYRELSNAEIE